MRRSSFLCALSFFLLLLVGCASLHRAEGSAAGFTESRPAPDIFKIVYPQHGLTHSERAYDLALLRASELTLQNGLPYFSTLEGRDAALQHPATAAKAPLLIY
jgi:hypothetical protein